MNSRTKFMTVIFAVLIKLAEPQAQVPPTDPNAKCDRSLKQQIDFRNCMGENFKWVDVVLNQTLGWADFSATAWKICNKTEDSVTEATTTPEETTVASQPGSTQCQN
ncbi:uncharacterized protein LOC144175505 [Haemaphysalis longicornis]